MAHIERSIVVSAPVQRAYNQWTQFEEFPSFMEGVEHVEQIDDTHLHWAAKIGGKRKEWDAEIVEQIPDRRIAWRATDGAPNGGDVSFESSGEDSTRIAVRIDYEPENLAEKAADAVGVAERRVEGDLERFKDMIERRGTETGAWRGEVRG
jgi:uncharacterized membrane protein